ncbi:nucleolin-like isoform X3 [Cebidichthys violaceus]|uniref:nucleolin-like isoform X3 n=1 Tax=Cebidichthys violaceus TaxID=271503 RepID=UPI0035CAD5DF
MAKANAARRSIRQSKVDTGEDVEDADNVKTGQAGAEEGAPKEDQAEQDHQMDTVIEVKGSTPTVTVSCEEGDVDDPEKRTNASDQMMDSEKPTPTISSADAVVSAEDAPAESAETEMKEEVQESGESQMDIVAGSTAAVTVTLEKNEEGESDGVKKETDGGEQTKKTAVKGKRKAPSSVETSPAKKTKSINDGYCLYVGNLNNSKTFNEVKDSLANYFMTQSLLVQGIRLHRSRKHAHVDLASEMDLTKGLTLNGKMIHDKPLNIAKAKVKSEETVQKKTPSKSKKAAKDEKCLCLKNVPFNATKEDLLKVFQKAVDVRFPGGTEGPKKGLAFVEFENKMIADDVRQQKQGVEIQGRILIVDAVEKTNVPKVIDAKEEAPTPSKTLYVSNLPFNVKEGNLKKVFQTAVSVSVPKCEGKSKGFAFVEFAAVADAEKALQSSQNIKFNKRVTRVEFCKTQAQSEQDKVQSKTLIVMGLAKKTTADTLKSAFEGAVGARVTVDANTGGSRMFGFVEFESEDDCKAAKEAMEDCEIDGSKVTVAFAKPRAAEAPQTADGQPAGQEAGKGEGRKRKGRRRRAAKPQVAVKEVEIKG